jgi:Carboxypeptidase regulatory-like domain
MKKIQFAPTPAWIRIAFGAVLLVLTVSSISHPAKMFAQSNVSGDVAGTVTDPSGKAVVGATVTIKSQSTDAAKVATTGANGTYRISLLNPGQYSVTVSASGFESSAASTSVSAGQINTQDIQLAVGSSSQTIEVTGTEVPLLHTEDAQISTTFDQQQVQSLPNPGNDLTFIAQTSPGAVENTQGGYGNFAIFGLPATSNTFTVNGGYENDPFLNLNNSGASNLLLGNNDVGSVTVVSNAYGVQYGGLGGSQVNEISRSGSNRFHGDATYWWNGSVLNANDYFNNQTATPKPRSNANQWAGSFGGPIVKDKSFFFFNTEGLRVIIPVRGTVFAPSPSYIASTLATINPNDVPFYNRLFSVYTGNPRYATAAVDANDPNAVSFSSNSANFAHEWLISGRVDQRLTDKDNLFGHFKVDKGVQPTYTSLLNPLFNAASPQPEYEGQLNETHVFNPQIANQFVFATIYYRAIFTNTNQAAANLIAPFTLEWLDGDLGTSQLNSGLLGGNNFAFPQGRNVTGYQFVDDFSVARGKHNFKAGFAFRRDDVTDYGPSVLTTPLVLTTEASFESGIGDIYLQQFPEHYDQPVALYTLGFYVQDQWKALSNLNVTYGIRFEHNSNPICRTNCYSSLASDFAGLSTDTTTPYNQLIVPNRGSAFYNFQKVSYEPRVGFSYTPLGVDTHTVVRGGFGLFADSFPAQVADSLLNNAPTNLQAVVGGGALNPAAAGSDAALAAGTNAAFHAGFAGGGSATSIAASNPFFSPFSFYNAARKISNPTYEEWNLQIEQQIGKATSVSIDYVGNHGYHEPVVANSLNTFNGGVPGFAELPTSAPNGNFGPVTQVYSGASSNYNGLIFSAVRRTKSLTVQFNYTYSHALDESSNGGFNPFGGNSVNPTNPFNLASNYGNADYDTRHYVNGSYVYTLPYYRGPRFVTDGWEVAGTVFHSNGLPFTETDATTGAGLGNYNGGNGGGLLFARQIVPHVGTSCSGGAHVFNNATGGGTPCGIANEYGTATDFGQSARNQVFGPHYTDFDFAVNKGFAIPHWEGAKLKLGVQFFNIFNHPNFGQPSHDVNSSLNGLVTTTVNPPTSILGSFLGGDASPRLIQTKLSFTF